MAFGSILWMILVKGLEKNLSGNCYDKKGDLSEIIGHSNYLCNHCIDSLHSMAVIKTCSNIGRKEKCGVPNSGLSKISCLFRVAILCIITNYKYGITGCDPASICLKL